MSWSSILSPSRFEVSGSYCRDWCCRRRGAVSADVSTVDAAPVALVAGAAGPLIGADLLHLREIGQRAVGVASIGGAGTFDGIVLSGIFAAYLS